MGGLESGSSVAKNGWVEFGRPRLKVDDVSKLTSRIKWLGDQARASGDLGGASDKRRVSTMCRWRISARDHHKPFDIIHVQESFAMGCSLLAVCYSLFQNEKNARRKASEVEKA